MTNDSLPENTTIESNTDLGTHGITDTDLCGSVDRVFTKAEIATVHCLMIGRYVLVHQYSGDKMILCEVIVFENQYSGEITII